MKLHLVLTVWPVTKGNHAGMYYLAKQIQETLGCKVSIHKIPVFNNGHLYFVSRLYAILLGFYLRLITNKDDIVWLMEYLLRSTEQSDIARVLKGHTRLFGIAHLVPEMIQSQYSDNEMVDKINYLDKLYVLGSSLKKFFISKGVKDEKICVTYHYVDTNFYQYDTSKREDDISVICMGNMKRNYDDLQAIVKGCPDLHFIICCGLHDLKPKFKDFNNVTLVGYVTEDELRCLMQSASISLNVMNDTIGSNVIVSSLATGLPVVASNVGSICDYVTNKKDGMLFKNNEEAIEQLNFLVKNPYFIQELSDNARKKAETISLQNFISFITQDMNMACNE